MLKKVSSPHGPVSGLKAIKIALYLGLSWLEWVWPGHTSGTLKGKRGTVPLFPENRPSVIGPFS